MDGWRNISWCGWRPMAQSRTKVPKRTEMTTDGIGKDKDQPYGKLKWTEIIILIGAVVMATLFMLFYFNS
jgi:hypothetical protein